MLSRFFTILLLISGAVQCRTTHPAEDIPFSATLREGDLLFQDLDCGPLCDAIEAVTDGAGGRDFSHLGLVCRQGNRWMVVEAIGDSVQCTPVADFCRRCRPDQLLHARVKPQWENVAHEAVRFALAQRGAPYDDPFLPDNGRWYCSELVYEAFKWGNQNQPFFQLFPMTFKDPATGQFFSAWQTYYKALNIPIPEGLPGCNPGGISRSDKLYFPK